MGFAWRRDWPRERQRLRVGMWFSDRRCGNVVEMIYLRAYQTLQPRTEDLHIPKDIDYLPTCT